MAPAKRSASDILSGPAKRAALKAGLTEIDSLTSALCNEQWMPESLLPSKTRQMLAAGAPYALAPLPEERHASQISLVGHIREVLEKAAAELSLRAEEAKRGCEEKRQEMNGAESEKQVADAAADEARAALATQQEKVDEQIMLAKSAEKEVKAVEVAEKACAKERAVSTKEKDRLKAIEVEGLQALLDRTVSDKEFKKLSTKTMKELEKMGADAALLAALTSVLQKKAEERESFDTMVMDQARALIHEKIAVVDAALETNDAKVASIAADLDSKQKTLQGRQQDVQEAKALLQRLNEILSEASTAATMKSEVVNDLHMFCTNLEMTVASADSEGSKLQAVRDAFETMAARSDKQQVAEEEPREEENAEAEQ